MICSSQPEQLKDTWLSWRRWNHPPHSRRGTSRLSFLSARREKPKAPQPAICHQPHLSRRLPKLPAFDTRQIRWPDFVRPPVWDNAKRLGLLYSIGAIVAAIQPHHQGYRRYRPDIARRFHGTPHLKPAKAFQIQMGVGKIQADQFPQCQETTFEEARGCLHIL